MKLTMMTSLSSKLLDDKNLVREAWDHLSKIPLGKRAFSFIVGKIAPYTGNMKAQVIELRPGYAKVILKERAAVRNHLNSIHAIALANLAELAGNIALTYSLPADARFIVTKMDMDYVKKARGTIYAISDCPQPKSNKRQEYPVQVKIFNEHDDLLCKATFLSLVGPK